MQLTIAAILAAAGSSPDAVTKLCAGLTDEGLRAEIELLAGVPDDADPDSLWVIRRPIDLRWPPTFHAPDIARPADIRQARAALETERDRRTKAAMIATLPEDKRL